MSNKTALSLAFIERQPLSATRAMVAMNPVDAAALLEAIPSRYGVILISRMSGWPAALILAQLTPQTGAALLQGISYLDSISILRLLPEDQSALILDWLPKKLKHDFKSSLTFPQDTVGARMTPQILMLESTQTVEDALALVRRSPKDIPQIVYIVSEERKLTGTLDVAELLHYRQTSTLGEIRRSPPQGLSARTQLTTVENLSAWHDTMYLPVLSRRKHLIGALSRKAALRDDFVDLDFSKDISLAGAMIEAFFVSGMGLAQLLVKNYPTGSDRSEP